MHRLLQRFGFDGTMEVMTLDTVRSMLREEEMGDADAAACVEAAVAAYRLVCEQADVRTLYATGDRLHEVPFTMRADGRFVRGSIDCLVRTAADRLTVLEFKTGRPREEHRAQVDLYRQAAERLFPGCAIDARLIYAGEMIVS